MNMQLLLGLWAAVLAAYATVTIMRWNLGKREDDHLHVLDSEQQLISTQTSIAHKLDVLDRWKTALLVLVILLALLIGAFQIWRVWSESSTQPIFS
jgi:hypothetical protein